MMIEFTYKEETFNWKAEFPKLEVEALKQRIEKLKDQNPHKTVINILDELISGSCNFYWLYENFSEKKFEEKCHQASSGLGLFLSVLGLEAYFLECYQVKDKGSPDAVQSEESKELGHNPYCLIEINLGNNTFLISPKHFNDALISLLQPDSHRDFVGVLVHPEDPTKSGVYVKNLSSKREPIWLKKDYKGSEEYFKVFKRMKFSNEIQKTGSV